ncbi:hypothetical protein Hanom_Chr04g00377601 [Helianthus anomalus]
MCHLILTGIIHDQRGIKMSVQPLMVKLVSVFNGASYVVNMGFYAKEIARANKEKMLAEMEGGRRKLPVREKGITYVNKSPYFRRGWTLMKIQVRMISVYVVTSSTMRKYYIAYMRIQVERKRERGQAWVEGLINEEYRANPRAG